MSDECRIEMASAGHSSLIIHHSSFLTRADPTSERSTTRSSNCSTSYSRSCLTCRLTCCSDRESIRESMPGCQDCCSTNSMSCCLNWRTGSRRHRRDDGDARGHAARRGLAALLGLLGEARAAGLSGNLLRDLRRREDGRARTDAADTTHDRTSFFERNSHRPGGVTAVVARFRAGWRGASCVAASTVVYRPFPAERSLRLRQVLMLAGRATMAYGTRSSPSG